ncbi:MAG TPA: hypothetical protein VFQ61_14220 [Polyangiaceae bacterium]|nr:hypothetical protein [Polyangiaceae bacterium]
MMVDKKDALSVVKRSVQLQRVQAQGAPTQGARKVSSFAALERSQDEFAPYAHGPALVGPHAYWVSQKRLVRRRLDGTGELEVLTQDAQNATRVAGWMNGSEAWVAYITQPDKEGARHAKLWTEGHGTHDLTPEGAGSSSVGLTRARGGVLAVTLDGRSGMTPLHTRLLTSEPAGVRLGPDVVSWVGGSSQGTTELFTTTTSNDEAWAFVPIEQDVTHFGLAQIQLGTAPNPDASAEFIVFANGMNASVVASVQACGQTWVAFARPVKAVEGTQGSSPQELVLARLDATGLNQPTLLAKARVFADVSLASSTGGAMLAYTADHRTWAASLWCRS